MNFERPIALTELPQSCMGFVLKSGETFFIHDEDVKNIAAQIIIEGAIRKAVVIIKEKDNSIEKADMLYRILKDEKDMKPELRHRYLKQISELLSGNSKQLITTPGGQDVEIKDSTDEVATPLIEKSKL